MAYNMDRWRELLPDGWRPSWLPQMPFTDYHQLNLDWIIETVKEWTERLVAFFDEDGAKDLMEDVLEEHPEWVTTVMDGSITKQKINVNFLPDIENEYVTPEMHGYPINTHALTDAIADALANNKMLICYNPVTLTENTDMTGVRIKATKIVLNSHDLLLGGGMTPEQADPATGYTDYDQYIELITRTSMNDAGKVYIRNCHGIHIYIGQAREVCFRTNNIQRSCAYSTFDFKYVDTIDIDADELNPDGTENIIGNISTYGNWFNENKFKLNRCVKFIEHENVSFGRNWIEGGCFEGAYRIEIQRGSGNVFDFLRLETSITAQSAIILGKNTSGNELIVPLVYSKKVQDNGASNIIKYEELKNSSIVVSDFVTTETLSNPMFSNLLDNGDGYFKFTGPNLGIIWISPYLTDPDKKFMSVYAAANYYAIPLFYQIFDENYNQLSDLRRADGSIAALYSLRTAQSAYENGTEGPYVTQANPVSQCSGTVNDVGNDFMLLYPTSVFTLLSDEDRARIKYVRFGIRNHFYVHSDQTLLKSLAINIGTINGTQSTKFRPVT